MRGNRGGSTTYIVNRRIVRWLLAILLLTIFLTGVASASWWNSDWQYRKEITISNTGAELTDYQVLVLLNASNFDYAKGNSLFRTGGKKVMMI